MRKKKLKNRPVRREKGKKRSLTERKFEAFCFEGREQTLASFSEKENRRACPAIKDRKRAGNASF